MQSGMIYAQYIKNNAYCLTFISFNFSKVEITQFFSRNKTMIVWKHRLNKFTPRDYNKHEMLQTFYFFGTKTIDPLSKFHTFGSPQTRNTVTLVRVVESLISLFALRAIIESETINR